MPEIFFVGFFFFSSLILFSLLGFFYIGKTNTQSLTLHSSLQNHLWLSGGIEQSNLSGNKADFTCLAVVHCSDDVTQPWATVVLSIQLHTTVLQRVALAHLRRRWLVKEKGGDFFPTSSCQRKRNIAVTLQCSCLF